jgi:uncharacterized protein YbdZ (MbtH family)
LIYTVVVNHQEQYSIWPSHRELPLGWRAVGKTGPKAQCLDYIEQVWRDMRPLSLRKHMEAARVAKAAGQVAGPRDTDESQPPSREPSLVEGLCLGPHPVEAALRPENTAATLKECIERGFVPIRFPHTRGQTELGMTLDTAASVMRAADFENRNGTVHLEGTLSLNGQNVRCIVELDLATLRGQGHLVGVAEESP